MCGVSGERTISWTGVLMKRAEAVDIMADFIVRWTTTPSMGFEEWCGGDSPGAMEIAAKYRLIAEEMLDKLEWYS